MIAFSTTAKVEDRPKTLLPVSLFWYYAGNSWPDGTAMCHKESRRKQTISSIMGR
jgi:hypothetical protein